MNINLLIYEKVLFGASFTCLLHERLLIRTCETEKNLLQSNILIFDAFCFVTGRCMQMDSIYGVPVQQCFTDKTPWTGVHFLNQVMNADRN